MNLFTVGWLIIVIAGLVLEFWAIFRSERGDTLSEHVWKVLRIHPIVWFMAAGLVAWTVIHFFARTWEAP